MTQQRDSEGDAPTVAPALSQPSRNTGSITPPTPDVDDLQQGVARATGIGAIAWPLFFPLDVFLAYTVHPGASLWACITMRIAGTAFLAFVNRRVRKPGLTPAAIQVWHVVGFTGGGLGVALLAIQLGGLRAEYVHGMSIIFLLQAAVVPVRWQLSLRTTLPVLVAYLLAVIGWAWFSENPALRDGAVMASFAANFVLVVSLGAIASIASQQMWKARRQVYEARKLGRYRLKARVGQGGMNEIWLAWDEALRRDVALKILRSAQHDDAAVARFEREARAASRLRSPHTIQIYEFGASDDGIYYIAMEYLPGADLGTLVREHGAMPPGRAVRFIRSACVSLAEAHQRGVVHRDIKPHNLFATSVGDDPDFLKLLDFGIARVTGPTDDQLTHGGPGVLRGTPAYMSPEVCKGGVADARSDIYSLGATLYYLLAGAPPFDGNSGGNLLLAHLTEIPMPPSIRRGSPVPRALEDVALKCLAKEPGDRYASARELMDALDAAADAGTWTVEDARAFWTLRRPLTALAQQPASLRDPTVADKPRTRQTKSAG